MPFIMLHDGCLRGQPTCFLPPEITEHDSKCVLGVIRRHGAFAGSLVLLMWTVFSMCKIPSQWLIVSPNSFNMLFWCYLFWICMYCVSLFTTDHSWSTFNEPDAGLSIQVTTAAGLLALPWRSLKRVWVDEGWRCATGGRSRDHEWFSCWNKMVRVESGGRRGW